MNKNLVYNLLMKINNYIEHTILKPNVTKKELTTFLDEAKEYSFKGVCINPCHIAFAKEYLKNTPVNIVTVIGFPLGANSTATKAFEASQAVKDGADEIDMVINITALKEGQDEFVRQDIKEVVKASEGKPVKVILETDLITKEEIKKACQICIEAGAKFVKTSTGFVKDGVGATVENVKLMYETVKDFGLEVKASGGIRSLEDANKMIEAGATRLGTSAGVKIVQGLSSNSGY
jgi:deoxyribose-phosphate aldolase